MTSLKLEIVMIISLRGLKLEPIKKYFIDNHAVHQQFYF